MLDRAPGGDAANHELVGSLSTAARRRAIEFTEFYLSTLTRFDDGELARLRERYLDGASRPRHQHAARAIVDSTAWPAIWSIVTTRSRFAFACREPIARRVRHHGRDRDGGRSESNGRYTGRVAGVPNAREGKARAAPMFLAARGQRLADFRRVYAYCDSLSTTSRSAIAVQCRSVAVTADRVLSAYARHMGWPAMSPPA